MYVKGLELLLAFQGMLLDSVFHVYIFSYSYISSPLILSIDFRGFGSEPCGFGSMR